MFGRGARIVAQPSKREIGAQAIEQSERTRIVYPIVEQAIGDFISDIGEFGRRKPARKVFCADICKIVIGIKDIRKRNFLPPRTGNDFDPVIGDQNVDLFGKIIGKERRLGHAREVVARFGQAPE